MLRGVQVERRRGGVEDSEAAGQPFALELPGETDLALTTIEVEMTLTSARVDRAADVVLSPVGMWGYPERTLNDCRLLAEGVVRALFSPAALSSRQRS